MRLVRNETRKTLLVRIGNTLLTAVALLLLSGLNVEPADAGPKKDYVLTKRSYPETANLRQIVRDRFGPGARIADWADIKSRFSPARIDDWADRIGLGHKNSAWVRRNGKRWHAGGKRHYFIKRHDGNKSRNFLAHDDIGRYIVTLGSWYNQRKPILVVLPAPKH